MTVDMVNSPPHYTQGRYEVIDVLEDWFSDDPLGWQVGKYIARYKHKNGVEDLKKARYYLNRLIDQYEHKPEAEPRVWDTPQEIPDDVRAVWSGDSMAMRSEHEGWWWVYSPETMRPLTEAEWSRAEQNLKEWDSKYGGWQFNEFHAPFTEAVVGD